MFKNPFIKCTLLLILINYFILSANAATDRTVVSKSLTTQCRIAIAETIHAKESQGDILWPGWSRTTCPINVVTEKYEFLLGTPDPPAEYTFLEHDTLLDCSIYYKPRTFKSLLIGSVVPFKNKLAIFISPPELFIEKFKIDMVFYRTLLLHEMFHIHQISALPGGFKTLVNFQLNKKYPYKTEPNNLYRATEADILKKAVIAKNMPETISQIKQFLKARQHRRFKMLTTHPKNYTGKTLLYEKFREWQEGLARYTEVKMNQIMTNRCYKPIPEFRKYLTKRKSTFKREMKKLDSLSLNSGEESDYALGWIQWYILDTLFPEWKSMAFKKYIFPEDLLKKALNL